eukprot:TRINITY_DN5236_c3_g1_i1.p1 TRINITY_DN5236_c3_g1~~TRINITY_DN5236_c3_g1_i1.p1  ORF type:complete len:865 (+),score=142.41 TRINITY_DN5236_c3_g1_i1:77-2671(+)
MGFVGIQSMTLALTASMMLATSAILGGIAITTGDESTADARDAGDRGVNRCMDSGGENVKSVTSRLLSSILKEFRGQVYEIIVSPSDFGKEISTFLGMLHPDTLGNPDFLDNTMRPLLFTKHKLHYERYHDSGTVLWIDDVSPNSDELRKAYNDSWGGVLSFFIAGFDDQGVASHGVIESRKYYPDGPISMNLLMEFGNADSSGNIIPGPCNYTTTLEYGRCKIALAAAFDPVRVELLRRCYDNAFGSDDTSFLQPPGQVIYSPIAGAGPNVALQTCTSISNPLQVNKTSRQQGMIGHIDAAQNTAGITKYLKNISLPQDTVLYAIEKHPWTGVVSTIAGCNIGEPHHTERQFDAQGNELWRLASTLPAVNHTDDDGELSPIARHSRHILHDMSTDSAMGDYYEYASTITEGTILEWTDPNTTILYWSSFGKVEFANIKWYMVLLIPRNAMMSVIDAAEESIRIDIAADKKEADDQRREKHIIMYAVTSSCVAILLTLAVVLTNIIISPLKVLINEMAAVAVMQTDAVNLSSPLSGLSEVREMQTSFRAMVKNLMEYRNYMPQSVLYSSDDSTDFISKTEAESGYGSSMRIGSASVLSGSSNTNKHHQHATEIGIRNRNVSVVFFNSVGWHSSYNHGSEESEQVLERHRSLIESLVQAVDTNRGVCDSFNGDRMMAYFNAVRTAAEHKSLAVKAAVIAKKQCPLNISFGVTSGSAKVGNMGIAGMKKYSILSTIVPFAAALERLNSSKGYNGLIDSRCYEYSNLVVESRALVLVMYSKRSEAPTVVYEACAIRKLEEQEWMYQINSDSAYAKWNTAVSKLVEGDFEAASEYFNGPDGEELSGSSIFDTWKRACNDRKLHPLELV